MKKLLSGFLAVMFCLQLLAIPALAEDAIILDYIKNDDISDENIGGGQSFIVNVPTGETVTFFWPIDREIPHHNAVTLEKGTTVLLVGDVGPGGDKAAVYVANDSKLTVQGEIATTIRGGTIIQPSQYNAGVVANYGNAAIYAENNGIVTVTGNVSSQLEAVIADHATVSIVGDAVSTYPDPNLIVKPNVYLDPNTGEVSFLSNYTSRQLAAPVINADQSNVSVGGSVTNQHGDGIQAKNESTVVVKNVIIDDSFSTAIDAENSNTVVTVKDSISSKGYGIVATDSSTVNVNNNVTAEHTAVKANNAEVNIGSLTSNNGAGLEVEKATANIAGNIQAKSDAIDAAGSTVQVGGNVSSSSGYGINAKKGAEINVDGNLTAEANHAIWAKAADSSEATSITVGGEIKAKKDGVDATATNGGSVLVTTGNIAAEGTNGIFSFSDPFSENSSVEITAGTISAADKGIFAAGKSDVTAASVTAANTGIEAVSGSSVSIAEFVNATVGVSAKHENTNVTVTNIIADELGASLAEGATVTVGDSVTSQKNGIDAQSGAGATVYGNVVAKELAVKATDENTSVVVLGDITSSDAESINAKANAEVTVFGDVTSENSTGILADNDGNVHVEGDVSAAAEGVKVEIDSTTAEGCVFIDGTVTAGTSAFVIQDTTNSLDADAFFTNIPDIIVYEATPAADYVEIQSTALTAQEEAELSEKIAKEAIEYIIRSDAEHGTISLTTATYLPNEGVYVANEGTITIHVVPDPGYSVKSVTGGKATITLLSDGSYEVNIPRGGGVDIFALCEKIAEINNDPNGGNSNGKHEIPLIRANEGTVITEYICVSDAEGCNEGVTQVDTSEKLEGLSWSQKQAVRNVDMKHTKVTGLKIKDYVFGESIRIEVENSPKNVTLYASSDAISQAAVLFFDFQADTWSILEAEVEADTGLISFEAPGNGIVSLLVKDWK
ncbi:MAG: hypothetical protein MJ135_06585 [Oscillospiraceae bacterium]|nr:hypothetical protein [Oscillospiraceae bacterium]